MSAALVPYGSDSSDASDRGEASDASDRSDSEFEQADDEVKADEIDSTAWDGEDASETHTTATTTTLASLGEGFKIDAAPDIDDEEPVDATFKRVRIDNGLRASVAAAGAGFGAGTLMSSNATSGVAAGAAAAAAASASGKPTKKADAGKYQVIYTDDYLFEESRHMHNKMGITLNPAIVAGAQTTSSNRYGGATYVGTLAEARTALASLSASSGLISERKRGRPSEQTREAASKDASDLDGYKGPWARYQSEVEAEQRGPPELTEEQKKFREAWLAKKISKGSRLDPELEKEAKRIQEAKEREEADKLAAALETTEFFGTGPLKDSFGRSFVDFPPGVKIPDTSQMLPAGTCYAPKNRLFTWNAKSKGVSAAKFFPRSGHLMLSAGMDGIARIYETTGHRPLMRTYSGHTQAIRDISFTDAGRKFFTCSYDKQVKLWDTETGQVVARYTADSTPYCVTPHPTQDECLIGTHGKSIVQWDWRSNDVIQEYKEHLAAVNSVLFLSDDQFISTGDDNKLLVWDYGVPVVVKHIASSDLQSVPTIALHPSGSHLVGNAQDNQTLVFATNPSVRLNRRKRFVGHNTSGFACGLTFSPDGQYLCSGDAEGRIFVWEWTTGRLIRKIKAHEQVCVGVQWHPYEPSKLLSCSWDGTVKLWS